MSRQTRLATRAFDLGCDVAYRDLGADYYLERLGSDGRARKTIRLVNQLNDLGFASLSLRVRGWTAAAALADWEAGRAE